MRGTSNTNERGSSYSRRARKAWLVETYRADRDMHALVAECLAEGSIVNPLRSWVMDGVPRGEGAPACRCYRCGKLLTVSLVTVDRIKPGCKGGTYARSNIRPACSTCNSSTGGKLGAEQRALKAAA
ncbi:HNH endonuclease signature motif containing protein [Kribbella sindirgiensis]|uniref:HNH endonuclease signature motif containing protein n=1 Tax=Kribbella sindirgiensis TaxID=1124744 RepID=UPI00192E0EA7|nr:HNH endonuclease signature motif containing protein [Kribbella sindirgiensis]